MSTDPGSGPAAEEPEAQPGVADSLRTAVERTMKATAGSAATTAERAGELVDDVVRRGRDARGELARRGQEAGAGLARRGQEATGEVGRRLELLEGRLAELEDRLAGAEAEVGGAPGAETDPSSESNPKAEG